MSDVKRVSEIKVGQRVRRELGDLSGLADSIAKLGLLHPIVVNVDGQLVAGERRLRAVEQLGWTEVPVRVVDLDAILDAESDENTMRRDFTPSEAYAMAEALREREAAAAKARMIGAPHRSENVSERDRGETRARVAAKVGLSFKTLEKVAEVIEAAEADPELAPIVETMDRTGNVSGALKKVRAAKVAQERTEKLAQLEPEADRFVRIVGDCRDELPKIADGSVDAIVTDPPYPREYLPLYRTLAEQAARVLKDGGVLAVMCGQSYLPELLQLMDVPGLSYRWTIAYLTPGGQATQVFPRKVETFWKPVLVYGKGEPRAWMGDVARSLVNDNDKAHHVWGQSESGMADLIERLTATGDLILDPFAGAHTTGIVAVQLGRRYIGIDLPMEQVA